MPELLSLCEEKPPVTDLFSAQKDSNVANVPIWWRQNAMLVSEIPGRSVSELIGRNCYSMFFVLKKV